MMLFRKWLEAQNVAGAFNRTGRHQEVFGWLSPRGNFYETGMFGHMEAVAKFPELKKLIPEFDENWADLEQRKQSSLDLIDQGEHPEWHGYEMASDDFQRRAMTHLYQSGCLRVGSRGSTMYFEGLPNGIKSLFQKAKDLAEEHGMDAKFEPTIR